MKLDPHRITITLASLTGGESRSTSVIDNTNAKPTLKRKITHTKCGGVITETAKSKTSARSRCNRCGDEWNVDWSKCERPTIADEP